MEPETGAASQAGAIGREPMFDLFRCGEVLPAGRTDDDEARLTAGNLPVGKSPAAQSQSSTTDDTDGHG